MKKIIIIFLVLFGAWFYHSKQSPQNNSIEKIFTQFANKSQDFINTVKHSISRAVNVVRDPDEETAGAQENNEIDTAEMVDEQLEEVFSEDNVEGTKEKAAAAEKEESKEPAKKGITAGDEITLFLVNGGSLAGTLIREKEEGDEIKCEGGLIGFSRASSR